MQVPRLLQYLVRGARADALRPERPSEGVARAAVEPAQGSAGPVSGIQSLQGHSADLQIPPPPRAPGPLLEESPPSSGDLGPWSL
mgnify:CR=1 FL=1